MKKYQENTGRGTWKKGRANRGASRSGSQNTSLGGREKIHETCQILGLPAFWTFQQEGEGRNLKPTQFLKWPPVPKGKAGLPPKSNTVLTMDHGSVSRNASDRKSSVSELPVITQPFSFL